MATYRVNTNWTLSKQMVSNKTAALFASYMWRASLIEAF